MPEIIKLRPSEICFSQNSISNKFDDGTNIGEALDDIIAGRCFMSGLPTISVVEKNDSWITVDNRRLWIFKQLEATGRCDHIQVKVKRRLPPGRLTTKTQGVSIQIRGKVVSRSGQILYDPEKDASRRQNVKQTETCPDSKKKKKKRKPRKRKPKAKSSASPEIDRQEPVRDQGVEAQLETYDSEESDDNHFDNVNALSDKFTQLNRSVDILDEYIKRIIHVRCNNYDDYDTSEGYESDEDVIKWNDLDTDRYLGYQTSPVLDRPKTPDSCKASLTTEKNIFSNNNQSEQFDYQSNLDKRRYPGFSNGSGSNYAGIRENSSLHYGMQPRSTSLRSDVDDDITQYSVRHAPQYYSEPKVESKARSSFIYGRQTNATLPKYGVDGYSTRFSASNTSQHDSKPNVVSRPRSPFSYAKQPNVAPPKYDLDDINDYNMGASHNRQCYNESTIETRGSSSFISEKEPNGLSEFGVTDYDIQSSYHSSYDKTENKKSKNDSMCIIL